MNAGAYLREMKDVLVEVLVLDSTGRVKKLCVDELELSYRTSIFQKHPDWLVIEAVLQLTPGDKDEILSLIRSRKEKRVHAQPLEYPSAGSSFRNPDGHAAWQLVADSGLRGFTVGGAMVSEKHTNFIINANKATAQDIADVMHHVRHEVKKKCGLDMHQEVEFFNWNEN